MSILGCKVPMLSMLRSAKSTSSSTRPPCTSPSSKRSKSPSGRSTWQRPNSPSPSNSSQRFGSPSSSRSQSSTKGLDDCPSPQLPGCGSPARTVSDMSLPKSMSSVSSFGSASSPSRQRKKPNINYFGTAAISTTTGQEAQSAQL
mmetsp:Transcript_18032/g.28378  ORF Transcript_18032/g.28378 Transcript_18032/m.28378 type:complete len:145 (+) Transcript_18032:3-437(+)